MVALKLPEMNSWNILFGVLCIFIIVALAPQLAGHVKPNGPVIGGDVYQAFGIANFIGQGHAPWRDAVYAGEYNWYPWLFHLSMVVLSKVTFASMSTVFIWAPLLVTLLIAAAYYKLGKELFNPGVGFLTAFMVIFMTGVGRNSQVPVPVNFSYFLAALYFLFLYRAHVKAELKNVAGAGVLLGLVGLTHLHTFFACLVILFSYLVVSTAFRNMGCKGFKVPVTPLKIFIATLLLGFLVALPYLYPITSYGFSTARQIGTEIGTEPPSPLLLVVNYGPKNFPMFYFAAFGLFLGYKRKKPEDIIAWSLVLAVFLGFIHNLFTVPLLGFELQPYKFGFLAGPVYSLAGAFGLYYIAGQIAKKWEPLKGRTIFVVVAFALILLLTPFGRGYFGGQAFTGEWGPGVPLPVPYSDMNAWILENTERDAVFFTGPYTGSVVNTWTGRWVSTSEISHSSIFLDIEEKYRDSESFYVGGAEEAYRIAKEYGADYVLINIYEYQQYAGMGFNPENFLNSPHFGVEKSWAYPAEGGGTIPTYVLSVS